MNLRVALVSAAAVVAVGCAHGASIPVVDPATVADATITANVKTALLNDSRVDGTQVTISTQSGVVRLVGTQPSLEAAAQVVAIVQSVDGVREVQSSITVSPTSTADSDAQRHDR
jgi:hyperosmotically inducible protein